MQTFSSSEEHQAQNVIVQELSPIAPQSNPFFAGRVPVPPGINQSYKIAHVRLKGGRGFNRLSDTTEAEQFKLLAANELKLASCDWTVIQAIKASRQHVPLAMRIRFFYPTMWKRDIDGGEKAVIDAVFKHLELNDNLIVEKRTTKDIDKDDPRVEIELRAVLQK